MEITENPWFTYYLMKSMHNADLLMVPFQTRHYHAVHFTHLKYIPSIYLSLYIYTTFFRCHSWTIYSTMWYMYIIFGLTKLSDFSSLRLLKLTYLNFLWICVFHGIPYYAMNWIHSMQCFSDMHSFYTSVTWY